MSTRREKEQREMRYADAGERAEKRAQMFESTSLNLPKGARLFKFKEVKTYRLDILPYTVGDGNPFYEKGRHHYERTYWTYRLPTVNGIRTYCDPVKTFGIQTNVIRGFLDKMVRAGSVTQKEADEMGPKERQLFNVIDLDDKDAGVQIFEFSNFEFGMKVDKKVKKDKSRWGKFFALEGGFTIEVDVEETSFNGKTRYRPDKDLGINFVPRPDYSYDILDKVYCLDDIPKRVPLEELERVLNGGGEESGKESATEPPSAGSQNRSVSRAGPVTEEEEEEEEEEDDLPFVRGVKETTKEAGTSVGAGKSRSDDYDPDLDE